MDPGLDHDYLNPVPDSLIECLSVGRIDLPGWCETLHIHSLNHIEHHRSHSRLLYPDQCIQVLAAPFGDSVGEKCTVALFQGYILYLYKTAPPCG